MTLQEFQADERERTNLARDAFGLGFVVGFVVSVAGVVGLYFWLR
jgi:hypothetical protein